MVKVLKTFLALTSFANLVKLVASALASPSLPAVQQEASSLCTSDYELLHIVLVEVFEVHVLEGSESSFGTIIAVGLALLRLGRLLDRFVDGVVDEGGELIFRLVRPP